MMIFGVTGGSGSGKSTVSALLARRGVEIIDADKIARAVTEKGTPCLDELRDTFGTEIIRADGTLDRARLASIAFADAEATAKLNAITHKYIKREIEARLAASKSEITAIDGAVIIGSEVEPLCAFIVSVIADTETRIDRITRRDTLTREQALTRLGAQPSDEFYKTHSRYIIYNNGSAARLWLRVRRLYKKIKRYMAIE